MIVQMLKATIDNNSDATQEERRRSKSKVDVEGAKAKAIDQATTNDGVDQTRLRQQFNFSNSPDIKKQTRKAMMMRQH